MKGPWDTRLPVAGLTVEYESKGLHVECRWPTRASRSAVETIITITDKGAGAVVVPPTRMNLLSSSARDGLLRGVQGEGREHMKRLLDAVWLDLYNIYREQRPTTRPDPTRANGKVDWLLYPIWPATGSTGIAAAPGSFKSWTGQAIALSVATGKEVLTRNTTPPKAPGEVLYLDWESDERTFASRLRNLCFGAQVELEPWVPYREMRAPLVDAAADLADEIAEQHYRGVVVDSLSAGIGGTMVDDERSNLFWDAVRVLGVPVLVIAHKSAQAGRERSARFFGSVMHEARVRVAWNVERSPDTANVRWECFKDNATGHVGKRLAWAWEMHHGSADDPDELMAVTATGMNPNAVDLAPPPDDADGLSQQQRNIVGVLARGPLMAGEVADRLGVSQGTARAQLSRLLNRGSVERMGDGRWGIATGATL